MSSSPRRYGEASLRAADGLPPRAAFPYLARRAFKKVFGRSLGELWRDFEAAVARRIAPARAVRRSALTEHGFDRARAAVRPRRARSSTPSSIRTVFRRCCAWSPARSDVPESREPVSRRRASGSPGSRSSSIRVEVASAGGAAVGSVRGRTRRRAAAAPDARRARGRSRRVAGRPAHRLHGAARRPPRARYAGRSRRSAPAGAYPAPRSSREAGVQLRVAALVARRTIDRRSNACRAARGDRAGRSGDAAPSRGPWPRRSSGSAQRGAGVDARRPAAVRVGPRRRRLSALSRRRRRRARRRGWRAPAPTHAHPSRRADGRTLVFVGYTARWLRPLQHSARHGVDGRRRSAASRLRRSRQVCAPSRRRTGGRSTRSTRGRTRRWRTIAPRFWTPTLESDGDELVVGAATASNDALGRHAYAAGAGWSAARGRPDWQVAYAYDRWRPTLFANVSDDTDPWRDGDVRTREANAGAVVPFRRVRWTQSVLGAFHASTDEFDVHLRAPTGETVDAARRFAAAGASTPRVRTATRSASKKDGAPRVTHRADARSARRRRRRGRVDARPARLPARRCRGTPCSRLRSRRARRLG